MNIKQRLGKFFAADWAAGVLLLSATALALIMENSALSSFYHYFKELYIEIRIDEIVLGYSLHHWVTEALMVIFFIAVGLEIKREFLTGQLSNINYIILPTAAAIGGIIVPGVIFYLFTMGTPAVRGWAIPTATDIAFAVGVISLFGKRLPLTVRLFVLTLAVMDDIGAIVIIGAVYSTNINLIMLFYTACSFLILVGLNLLAVRFLPAYLLVGLLTWFFMLHTGIHPTLSGILIAMCVPLHIQPRPTLPRAFGMNLGSARMDYVSPAIRLEHYLEKSVSFAILPLFAFVNSGIDIGNIVAENLLFSSVSLGTFVGLLIGKPIGVLLGAFIWQLIFRAPLPPRLDYFNLIGIGLICGMGYTMSILITNIAFVDEHSYINQALLGILSGSFVAALVASLVFLLWIAKNKPRA